MGIAKYIKEIGRGKDGARSLNREQAADLMGQILDGEAGELEMGGFCLAMRIKGETALEMAGFLDATHTRLAKIEASCPVVVLPSYNGARKLPVLTPLLGALLARHGAQKGFAVLMHGCRTEDSRVDSKTVLQFFNASNKPFAGESIVKFAIDNIASGDLAFVDTDALQPGLKRLLDVRRAVGLRNSAHSMVKLMNPTATARALIISSYTHPEYLQSMTATLQLTGSHAMLLRGTEGESVADPRRTPQMDAFVHGQRSTLHPAQVGSLAHLPELPATTDPQVTAAYMNAVLSGEKPVPAPIAQQVECILQLLEQVNSVPDTLAI